MNPARQAAFIITPKLLASIAGRRGQRRHVRRRSCIAEPREILFSSAQ
jgi:hypothetical protein